MSRIRRSKTSLALTHGASVTTATPGAVRMNGLLREVLIKTPAAVDGSATCTVTLVDADGYTIYTKSGVAANTRVSDLLTTSVPVAGDYVVNATFSANQTTTDSTTEVTPIVDGL